MSAWDFYAEGFVFGALFSVGFLVLLVFVADLENDWRRR